MFIRNKRKPPLIMTTFQYQKLSEDYKQSGEGVITLDECSKVLNSFAINKTPGNDGLPIEFYQTFWNSVGELLVESFNESFIKGEMSPSQRQAIITLIEKKDQDSCDLKNWRPISLLNVDAKSFCGKAETCAA